MAGRGPGTGVIDRPPDPSFRHFSEQQHPFRIRLASGKRTTRQANDKLGNRGGVPRGTVADAVGVAQWPTRSVSETSASHPGSPTPSRGRERVPSGPAVGCRGRGQQTAQVPAETSSPDSTPRSSAASGVRGCSTWNSRRCVAQLLGDVPRGTVAGFPRASVASKPPKFQLEHPAHARARSHREGWARRGVPRGTVAGVAQLLGDVPRGTVAGSRVRAWPANRLSSNWSIRLRLEPGAIGRAGHAGDVPRGTAADATGRDPVDRPSSSWNIRLTLEPGAIGRAGRVGVFHVEQSRVSLSCSGMFHVEQSQVPACERGQQTA
jgi:hypothetical protein